MSNKRDGKLNSLFHSYHINGKINYICEYANNILTNVYEKYDEYGNDCLLRKSDKIVYLIGKASRIERDKKTEIFVVIVLIVSENAHIISELSYGDESKISQGYVIRIYDELGNNYYDVTHHILRNIVFTKGQNSENVNVFKHLKSCTHYLKKNKHYL